MNSLLIKLLMILAVTSMVAGCKVAVLVVEGGEVQSIGSDTCLEGSICVHQVNDTNFSETFTAVPNSGWAFVKWNSGGGFLCPGSTDPVCVVSSVGTEGNEAVEALVASDRTFYLMPIFKPVPPEIIVLDSGAIRVEGRDWLQPKDFSDYSYNQVSAVCPVGVCSGALPGSTFDLTGYTWASINDVKVLFNAYKEAGRAILEDFAYTTTDKATHFLWVMLSDPADENICVAVFGDSEPYPPVKGAITIFCDIFESSQPDGFYGTWFWKPAISEF